MDKVIKPLFKVALGNLKKTDKYLVSKSLRQIIQ